MPNDRPWSGRELHFVGIGGAGMSGLAAVAAALGARVTGSDRAESGYLAQVRAAGAQVMIGHAAEHVPPQAELVFSSAVTEENPERAVARERGQRELHRADLLGEMTRLKRCIAITGTHGKTTTASMAVHILRAVGADPAYVVGGKLRTTGTNAEWGAGEWLVVEADESDRSLLKLDPNIAVLTNLELEHHATYRSRLDLDQTIATFLAGAEQAVIWDRPELLALREGPAVSFDAAEVELDGTSSRFDWRGQDVRLSVPGRHNALNAIAALEATALAGTDRARAAAALADFAGAGRRFELIGDTAAGARVYDDYAHHPTEVAATIAAAGALDHRRIVAVFQPHTYSRTAALWREFGAALAAADVTVVLDVFPAREKASDFPGVGGLLIARAAADAAGGRKVAWLPAFDDAERFLRGELRAGDLCLVMGAGDIDALGRRLVD